MQNSAAWSYDMEGHAPKCVERHSELADKNIDQLCEVSTLCIDDHQFEPEELEAVGEVSQVCSQIVLKCLLLDAYRQTWRLETNWKEQSRNVQNLVTSAWPFLISYIQYTSNSRQCCHVGNAGN